MEFSWRMRIGQSRICMSKSSTKTNLPHQWHYAIIGQQLYCDFTLNRTRCEALTAPTSVSSRLWLDHSREEDRKSRQRRYDASSSTWKQFQLIEVLERFCMRATDYLL